jgi:hypothetical protein
MLLDIILILEIFLMKFFLNFSDEYIRAKNIINEISAINTHKEIAQRQQVAYKRDKETLSYDTLLIELDWKQKVIIGILIFYSFNDL